jgi:hypothetical protein
MLLLYMPYPVRTARQKIVVIIKNTGIYQSIFMMMKQGARAGGIGPQK